MKKARGRSGFLAVCIAPAVILFFCVYDIAYLKCIPDVVI